MLARINRRYVPAYWDDFFNDNFFNGFKNGVNHSYSPAVNVVEEDNEFRIEVAVPGMSKKDFNISLEEDVLTISSEQIRQILMLGTTRPALTSLLAVRTCSW